jgi:hypothetical protein
MTPLRQFDRSPLQAGLAVVLALVMVGFGFVQAVHVHNELAKPASPASHCSLCIASHNTAVVVTASNAPAPVLESAIIAVHETQFEPQVRIGASFIRPPPQSL